MREKRKGLTVRKLEAQKKRGLTEKIPHFLQNDSPVKMTTRPQ